MKSAYELAMERLDRQHGKVAATNAAQKKSIAEIAQRAKAKQAETEIIFKEARATGDIPTIRRLEEEMSIDIAKIRDQAETEKDAVRRDARLA
jgi:hypothetical protein